MPSDPSPPPGARGPEWTPPVPLALSRRAFLRRGGAAAAGAAVAGSGALGALAACQPAAPDVAARGPAANAPPATVHLTAHPPTTLAFFTPTEARAVEALTARILPGDADDPGAREAGVVYYVDRTLSLGDGYAEPTYRMGPVAQPYDGDAPPAAGAVPVVWVPREHWERYGWQSALTPREIWRRGLAALDALARDAHGAAFADLAEAQQDGLVRRLAGSAGRAGDVPGFDAPHARQFFALARRHTVEGMFSDPIHGGNRNLVGWRLIGHPGAQRAYTPAQMLDERHHELRGSQSLADLPPFHPGQPDRADAAYVVRGTHHLGRGR